MGQLVVAIDVWTLIAVNFFGVALCSTLTAVSLLAYLSRGQDTGLRNATVGFGLIAVGMAVEPGYQLVVQGSTVLASEQNVSLQILEGTVFALGFLVLFFSIYQYSPRPRRREIRVSGVEDDLLDGPE